MKTFLEIAAVCSLVGIVGFLASNTWLKMHGDAKAPRVRWKQFNDTD